MNRDIMRGAGIKQALQGERPVKRLRTVCAWCPTFDPADPNNAGASHVLCEACAKRMDAQLTALEQAHRDTREES